MPALPVVGPARVRVRTHPPLPPFQAWVVVDPSESIAHLKSTILGLICSQPTGQVILESQGFAFLDQSSCSVIDLANDLIDIKVFNPATAQKGSSKKRPRSTVSTPVPALETPTSNSTLIASLVPSPPPPQTSGPDPSRPVRPLPKSSTLSKSPAKPKPNVAPGQGKPKTKARNQRKRVRNNALRKAGLLLSNSQVGGQPAPAIRTADVSVPTAASLEVRLSPKRLDQSSSFTSEISPRNFRPGCIAQPQPIVDEPQSGSSSESSDSSSRSSSDSESAADSCSHSSSASTSESDSSAPSSAPTKLFTTTTASADQRPSIQAKLVPVIQDAQLKMLSLSNKNKRKNTRLQPLATVCPTKVVFTSSAPDGSVPASPTYTPASPGLTEAQNCDQASWEPHALSSPPRTAHHGPPPSLRDPSLIPSNVVITWVDVDHPDWEAGQTNLHPAPQLPHPVGLATSKRKRAQNKKKQVKRNKRAAAARSRGADLDDEEVEWDEELEDAYRDFLGSGGHSVGETDYKPILPATGSLEERWDDLVSIAREDAKVGDRVAVKVVELSLKTLTPELFRYSGTLTATCDQYFTLALDASCLPPSQQEEQEEHGEGGEDSRMVIRACQRDAIMLDRGFGDSEREWRWTEVAELKRVSD